MRSFLRALTFTAFGLASCAALAETKPAPAKPAAQAPQAKQELKMETVQLVALIKSTIMALQHANQTGNYSVLRDLGTPVFRERFDLAQLTAIFSNLRSRSVNLSPVLFLAPNLTKQPELTEGNQLRIVGDFPTQPLKIQYEMLFLQIDGVWRIDGLAIDAVPQQSTAATPAASASPSTPAGHQQPAKPTASNHSEKKPLKLTSQ
jgi:ribosomal protein L12E/L44/L45/RPP1/RPP2